MIEVAKKKEDGPCQHDGGRYETTDMRASGEVVAINTHCAKCDKIIEVKRPKK